MKNNIPCNVIVDLLPLYKEEICSEETKILVEEHLAECADCRRLSEQVTIPEVGKKEAPTESETFKKVGKKLKKSRFTKIMAWLMCICLILGISISGLWYLLIYQPYYHFGEHTIDNGYAFDIYTPDFLCNDGFLCVIPVENQKTIVDSNGNTTYECISAMTLFIWPRKNGTHYGVSIEVEKMGYQMYIDTDLNYIPSDLISDEENEFRRRILAEYHDEISCLMQAAQDKWGEYLK